MPERFFMDADGVIEWHRNKYPDSCERYLATKEKIHSSKFSGSAALLRNLEGNKTVTGFLSFLTEVNLADLFLDKHITDLSYEPKHMPGVDFFFDDIAISVKNLHPKNYEKAEQEVIDALQTAGGGKTSLTHKKFSDIAIEVKETEMGTYGWERLETGHSGFLDSDIYEMSAPLNYIGEFEESETGGHKKVLFFFIHSHEFTQYYIVDIVNWYFDHIGEHPIFQNDMEWYNKLLKKPHKKDNIDALIFMYSPDAVLSWPPSCLADIGGEARVQIYTREKAFFERLKTIFS
jgi:hypothetical protein